VGALSGKLMVLRFGSRSEVTELSGSNGVRTFRKELEFVSRYLVSMRTRIARDHPDAAYKYRGASRAI